MPFPMRIQPVDFKSSEEPLKTAAVTKSRFKRLFERQYFQSVLRISAPEKPVPGGVNKDGGEEFEPSSVCLDKMVQNFMEENNEKQGRHRCNCFNGDGTDSSDDELDSVNCFGESNHKSSADASDLLKSLVPCATVSERNLLADTAKIIEKNKISKRKDAFCRKIVTDGLLELGYNASICKSRWEKAPTFPAGEYEYVDVVIEGERLIIDIDFRSEFEVARSTKAYKSILQILPVIFVGKSDRLQRIVCIVCDAAKQSLKKKGMPLPPWRRADYVKAKWLSSYTRMNRASPPQSPSTLTGSIFGQGKGNIYEKQQKGMALAAHNSSGDELKPTVEEKIAPVKTNHNSSGIFNMSNTCEDSLVVKQPWEPPQVKPRSSQAGVKMVTGLSCVIAETP